MTLPDFDPSLRPSENVVLPLEEQGILAAIGEAEKHVGSVEQKSDTWRSFADWVDYHEAALGAKYRKDFDGRERTPSQRDNRAGNIEETMRQRVNENSVYARELRKAQNITNDLYTAYKKKQGYTIENFEVLKQLRGIKRETLHRFDRQTPSSPQK
jgi:hypothetical protein